MTVDFKDNSKAVLAAFQQAVEKGLEECGLVAEGYAKKLVNSPGKTGTGNLRNKITHKVDPNEATCYIGTNVDYAAYVELGTGKYYPGGRRGWWVYVNGSERKGNSKNLKTYTYEEAKQVVAILRSKGLDAHMTEGQPAKPFLKPAVADHAQQYRQIMENELKNG